MANNNWNNYTEKNVALTDKDEIMLRDSTDGKNKKSPLGKIWNYMVDKMATAVVSKLETDNKTIIGAINYLYGKVKRFNVSAGKTATLTYGNYATVSIIIIKSGIFIYSNGYLTEISNDKSVKAEISSNYKTITITNNMLGESAFGMAIFSNIIPGIVVE